jgi:hypothetical protein
MTMARQNWITIDRKLLLVGAILVLACLTPVVIWQFQGTGMRSDFIQSLRNGGVRALPLELQQKVWTEQELSQAEVLRVPESYGTQRAISRGIHDRGRLVVSSHQFEYQGTIQDDSTKIVHVFGLQRREPRTWRWVTIHPSSLRLHIERRQEQLEELNRKVQPD